MYLRSGYMLRVTNLIKHFDKLVGLVTSRMAGQLAGHLARSEKLQNRAARVRSSRALGRILFVGLSIIGIVLVITRKLP
jgi:hypothetical protein